MKYNPNLIFFCLFNIGVFAFIFKWDFMEYNTTNTFRLLAIIFHLFIFLRLRILKYYIIVDDNSLGINKLFRTTVSNFDDIERIQFQKSGCLMFSNKLVILTKKGKNVGIRYDFATEKSLNNLPALVNEKI